MPGCPQNRDQTFSSLTALPGSAAHLFPIAIMAVRCVLHNGGRRFDSPRSKGFAFFSSKILHQPSSSSRQKEGRRPTCCDACRRATQPKRRSGRRARRRVFTAQLLSSSLSCAFRCPLADPSPRHLLCLLLLEREREHPCLLQCFSSCPILNSESVSLTTFRERDSSRLPKRLPDAFVRSLLPFSD